MSRTEPQGLTRWTARLLAYLLALAAPIMMLRPFWLQIEAEDAAIEARELPPFLVPPVEFPAGEGSVDIVVIGDSLAHMDIVPEILSEELRPRGMKVRIYTGFGSPAAVWYAMLKERVYAEGARPRLVIITCIMRHLFETQMAPDEVHELLEQVRIPDAPLLRKAWPDEPPTRLERGIEIGRTWHEHVFSAIRERPVSYFFPSSGPSGQELLSNASRTVFGLVHEAQPGSALSAIPSAPALSEPTQNATRLIATTPDESLIPDLAALVQKHGGRLVVLLPPVMKSDDTLIEAQLEIGIEDYMNRLDVGWLDERHRSMDRRFFVDAKHLTEVGAAEYTRHVAKRLMEIGALTDGPMRPGVGKPVFTVSRRGQIPGIPYPVVVPEAAGCRVTAALEGVPFLARDALRARSSALTSPIQVLSHGDFLALAPPDDPGTCNNTYFFEDNTVRAQLAGNGDPSRGPLLEFVLRPDFPIADLGPLDLQHWVYPGTGAEWHFEAPLDGAQADAWVEVSGISFGQAPGTPALEVNGTIVPLQPSMGGFTARVPLPPADRPPHLVVSSPPDGPYIVIRDLRIDAGSASLRLVEPNFQLNLDFFLSGIIDVVGQAPPPVRAVPVRDPVAPWIPAPFENLVGCSPLIVHHNGQQLSRVQESELGRVPPGTALDHIGNRLYIRPIDLAPEGMPPGEYVLSYEPDRKCWARACFRCVERGWVYPGDRLRVTVPHDRRPYQPYGVYSLRIEADWNEAPSPAERLHVRLEMNGKTRLDTWPSLASLDGGLRLMLDAPILPEERGDLILQIESSPGAPPLLITALANED